ncbi:MAG TPA: hypothetical protein GX010_00665 [Erysipelotrichaceae bacterium]|nr:hypothetical protein [Erysipelotrichaceae bacterium]
MVMKDKLFKNQHHRLYYRFRKLGIVLLVAISIGTIIAVPTYITMREIGSHAQHAEEVQTPDDVPEIEVDNY